MLLTGSPFAASPFAVVQLSPRSPFSPNECEMNAPAPSGPFPIADQRRASLTLMQRIGFDFAHGRLDESAHPFSGGIPGDVRITTRYDEADFAKALMGTLHETGHAMYERGLPAEWRRQPVGTARGMAMHESQHGAAGIR